MNNKYNRRKFIRNSVLATAGTIVIPTIIPSCAKGTNDKITIGMIGTGDHGMRWNFRNYSRIKDTSRVIAICDVDKVRMESAKEIIDGTYEGTGCKTYSDFRDLLERKDIDGVQISTPDHWHVHQSIMAMEAGKDVISEKPTWTIQLGRTLSDYVAQSDRIFATSLEDRSLEPYYRMAMLVRNGYIGEIKKMRIGLPGEHSMKDYGGTDIKPVPKGFDWEMWLGPAPYSEYSPGKTHWNFRWCDDYSVGSIADWGAHIIDTAQWCNGTEKWGPVEVEGVGSMPATGYYDTFNQYSLTYRYENGLEMDVHGDFVEIFIEGTEGWLLVKGWNQALQASNPEWLNVDLSKQKVQLYTAKTEQDNFIECIKSRKEPYHPAEDMHRTATIAHMGHIAMKLQRKLKWDPEKEEFVNDEEANAMRSRIERDPWKLKNLMA